MKYVINIDEDNPISVTDREIVYMDNETGMTWTISKNGKKKLKPLEEHETKKIGWVCPVCGWDRKENNMSDMIKIPDVIRRKDAIDAFMDLPNCQNGYSDTYDKESIIGVLEEVQSMQDEIAKAVAAVIEQPEIIRCRDCVKRNNMGFCTILQNNIHGIATSWYKPEDDDFCSRAERREE